MTLAKSLASSVGRGSECSAIVGAGVLPMACKASIILIIAGWLDINGVDLFTHVDQPFEGSHPDQTDRGRCHFSEELVFRVTQGMWGIIIGIGSRNVCRVLAHGTWVRSLRSFGFVDGIGVIN